mmetsp:Transcript_1143/g.4497  ORF Transcript_1143/g.4497 Transcript_1143/m.4497 type:complete len:210 (-) Transcript_1143:2470-3099(-)
MRPRGRRPSPDPGLRKRFDRLNPPIPLTLACCCAMTRKPARVSPPVRRWRSGSKIASSSARDSVAIGLAAPICSASDRSSSSLESLSPFVNAASLLLKSKIARCDLPLLVSGGATKTSASPDVRLIMRRSPFSCSAPPPASAPAAISSSARFSFSASSSRIRKRASSSSSMSPKFCTSGMMGMSASMMAMAASRMTTMTRFRTNTVATK